MFDETVRTGEMVYTNVIDSQGFRNKTDRVISVNFTTYGDAFNGSELNGITSSATHITLSLAKQLIAELIRNVKKAEDEIEAIETAEVR